MRFSQDFEQDKLFQLCLLLWSSVSLHVFPLLLFSCWIMSDSLRPQELQHARLPCPLLSPWVCSNSCSLSWWYYSIISSSVAPFSSCPRSFPASWCFQMSWLFASGGQSIGASASVLPMNIEGWFPLGLTGLISLLSKELSRVFSSTTIEKASILWCPAFFMVHLSHLYMTLGKTIALTIQTFVGKVIRLYLVTVFTLVAIIWSFLTVIFFSQLGLLLPVFFFLFFLVGGRGWKKVVLETLWFQSLILIAVFTLSLLT